MIPARPLNEAYQAGFFMSIKRPYNKPPLSIQEQINLLEKRGIYIKDRALAEHYLQFIGYYRLSGYAHYFKVNDDQYLKGTTFEQILDHYIFDRKLRILLFDIIERIEVALRSAITNVMSMRHGAFWFTKEGLFVTHKGSRKIDIDFSIIKPIREATIENKNKPPFLEHYYKTYSSPNLPPSWVIMETLSIGLVSKIFSLLIVEERKEISSLFKLKEHHLVSWMRALTYTRNLCAHHSRVWNRTFTLKVEADKKYPFCREGIFHQGKFYAQAVVIAILLKKISPENHWESHIKDLISSYSHPYAQDMGFPNDWNGFHMGVLRKNPQKC